MVRAVLSGEDHRFFLHRGFEWSAIKRALELNLNERRVVAGASTISMQLVKNMFLDHQRTLARKAQYLAGMVRRNHISPEEFDLATGRKPLFVPQDT